MGTAGDKIILNNVIFIYTNNSLYLSKNTVYARIFVRGHYIRTEKQTVFQDLMDYINFVLLMATHVILK